MKYRTLFFVVLMMHASSFLQGMDDIKQQLTELKTKKAIATVSIRNKTQRLDRIKKIQRSPYLFSQNYQNSGYQSYDAYSEYLDLQRDELTQSIIHHQNYKEELKKTIDTLQRKIDQKKDKAISKKPTRI